MRTVNFEALPYSWQLLIPIIFFSPSLFTSLVYWFIILCFYQPMVMGHYSRPVACIEHCSVLHCLPPLQIRLDEKTFFLQIEFVFLNVQMVNCCPMVKLLSASQLLPSQNSAHRHTAGLMVCKNLAFMLWTQTAGQIKCFWSQLLCSYPLCNMVDGQCPLNVWRVNVVSLHAYLLSDSSPISNHFINAFTLPQIMRKLHTFEIH